MMDTAISSLCGWPGSLAEHPVFVGGADSLIPVGTCKWFGNETTKWVRSLLIHTVQTDQNMEAQVNNEYKSLEKFTTDLSNLLQHNVVTVSGRLLEKGLVTKDVHDALLTTEGVSGHKNAARLMSCVLDKVKCSSRCFDDFIEVLRDDPYYKDIVVKILEAHGKSHSWGHHRGVHSVAN